MFVGLGPVVAERIAQAATGLPLVGDDLCLSRVFGRGEVVVASVRAGDPGFKAVVDQALGTVVVEVGHDRGQVGLLRIADVVPEDDRVVTLPQLAPVRVGVGGKFGGVVDRRANQFVGGDGGGIEAPVQPARVIQPHFHAQAAHRPRQFADQVAFAAAAPGPKVRVLHPAGPEREPIVMLAGEYDVSGAGALEQAGHRQGVP